MWAPLGQAGGRFACRRPGSGLRTGAECSTGSVLDPLGVMPGLAVPFFVTSLVQRRPRLGGGCQSPVAVSRPSLAFASPLRTGLPVPPRALAIGPPLTRGPRREAEVPGVSCPGPFAWTDGPDDNASDSPHGLPVHARRITRLQPAQNAARWWRTVGSPPRAPGSTTTRSNRTGSRGSSTPIRQGSTVEQSERRHAHVRPLASVDRLLRADRTRATSASGPRRRRARAGGPGRPPRGRSRSGRHGHSGPGRSSRQPAGGPGPAIRRRHRPAGRRSVSATRSSLPCAR